MLVIPLPRFCHDKSDQKDGHTIFNLFVSLLNFWIRFLSSNEIKYMHLYLCRHNLLSAKQNNSIVARNLWILFSLVTSCITLVTNMYQWSPTCWGIFHLMDVWCWVISFPANFILSQVNITQPQGISETDRSENLFNFTQLKINGHNISPYVHCGVTVEFFP